LRCCSMPTNSSPGGRWLAGGVMMPPPIIGPRPPCAYSGTAARRNRKAASIEAAGIELTELLLRRTAFSFPAIRPVGLSRTGYRFSGTAIPGLVRASVRTHPSLRDLNPHFCSYPALKRRAKFGRPFGTGFQSLQFCILILHCSKPTASSLPGLVRYLVWLGCFCIRLA